MVIRVISVDCDRVLHTASCLFPPLLRVALGITETNRSVLQSSVHLLCTELSSEQQLEIDLLC